MPTDVPRINISSASPYEDVIGFSRAVRIGPYVHVSGTTAIGEDGDLTGVEDVHEQAVQVLHNIETALAQAGATMADVVRTRIYLRNIDHWQRVAEAHSEAFGEIRPASTMIEVSRFVDPRMLVEIDADAYVAGPEGAA
ncbi:MAG: RidA family protein [Chloroflexi bacterium]|nr:RidA family protein [Chloroflexota bacterium]